ncbi:MAG: hypothetical protein IPN71_00065 [Fibrobacteres bacterium]|nr:hypothetical protein [Fibrobacterota bacterium]
MLDAAQSIGDDPDRIFLHGNRADHPSQAAARQLFPLDEQGSVKKNCEDARRKSS